MKLTITLETVKELYPKAVLASLQLLFKQILICHHVVFATLAWSLLSPVALP